MTSAIPAFESWLSAEYAPDRASDIRGHLPMLYDAARGRRVMELGVDRGVSTSAFLAANEQHGGITLSVDCRDCRAFHGHPCWRFIQADSLDATIVPTGDPAFDVLFIDTDHSYGRTLGELKAWSGALRSDGVILLHDVDNPMYPGVGDAIREFIGHGGFSVAYHHGSFGLAEIRRNRDAVTAFGMPSEFGLTIS